MKFDFTKIGEKVPTIVSVILFVMIIGVSALVIMSESDDFTEVLVNKGKSLAQFMAKVAPTSLLAYDVSMLDNYTEELVRDREVLYAVILGEKENIISAFLNRNNELTTGFDLKENDTKSFINRIKDTEDIIEIKEPIMHLVNTDQQIGTVKIGLTKLFLKEKINRESIAIFVTTFIVIIFAYWRLNLINKQLETKVRARTRELEAFVYTISHDLKSPVVSMQGMASILMDEYGDSLDEDGKHFINRIITNANFMEEMVLNLLTLSRVGHEQEKPEAANVKDVVEEVVEILKERFSEKNIQVKIDPSLPDFVFGRPQLTHLFQNLISNAAKFVGDQPNPKIEIGGKELKKCVEFYVRDNGIGIDPAHHNTVFGIFHRLQEVKAEGTGVGLSVVKKVIDLSGGKIWIDSEIGKGSTFYFTLPKMSHYFQTEHA